MRILPWKRNFSLPRSVLERRIKLTPHLPTNKLLDSDKVFDRISQIWGIPIEKLLPKEETGRKSAMFSGQAMYNPETHTVTYLHENFLRSDRSHEHAHAAEGLVTPTKRSLPKMKERLAMIGISFGLNPKFWQQRKAEETLANLTSGYLGTDIRKDERDATAKAVILGGAINFLNPYAGTFIAAKAIGRTVDLHYLEKRLGKILDRYGDDGILLFMANPPRGIGLIGGLGGLETAIWEKIMVKKGYISPLQAGQEHSLTPKGIEFLQQKITRQKILERINRMEQNRKTNNPQK